MLGAPADSANQLAEDKSERADLETCWRQLAIAPPRESSEPSDRARGKKGSSASTEPSRKPSWQGLAERPSIGQTSYALVAPTLARAESVPVQWSGLGIAEREQLSSSSNQLGPRLPRPRSEHIEQTERPTQARNPPPSQVKADRSEASARSSSVGSLQASVKWEARAEQLDQQYQQPSQLRSVSSSSSYVTAPLTLNSPTHEESQSVYVTPKSRLTQASSDSSSTLNQEPLEEEEQATPAEMVSYEMDQNRRPAGLVANRHQLDRSDSETPTMTPNTEELEDEPMAPELVKSFTRTASSSYESTGASEDQLAGCENELDAEQLKRILGHKRLSEGCVNRIAASLVTRKNSLHMIEEMPALTEGEPMKHMSYHSSTFDPLSVASSGSSGSLRSAGGRAAQRDLIALKRASQDDNATSCSSTTSLERSPSHSSRRRSSTISQCSSVLSEGTRNQLNFDLSPDLAPDSSLLEANAISPVDLDRPPSPEPFSDGSPLSADGQYEARPMSQLSIQQDELMVASPDSTLGDSNERPELVGDQESRLYRLTRSYAHNQDLTSFCGNRPSETSNPLSEMLISSDSNQATAAHLASLSARVSGARQDQLLESLITDVGDVSVSTGATSGPLRLSSSKRPASDDSNQADSEQPGYNKGFKGASAGSRLPRLQLSQSSAESLHTSQVSSLSSEAAKRQDCFSTRSSSRSSASSLSRNHSHQAASMQNKNGKLG